MPYNGRESNENRVMISIINFDHLGNQYCVQISVESGTIRAQVFQNGSPASPCVYSVSLPMAFDMKILNRFDSVRAIIEEAKRDITDESRADMIRLLGSFSRARYLQTDEKRIGTAGYDDIEHRDVFDRPISQQDYCDFLELRDYHGYSPKGYGMGKVIKGDSEGKIWIYRHSSTCD